EPMNTLPVQKSPEGGWLYDPFSGQNLTQNDGSAIAFVQSRGKWRRHTRCEPASGPGFIYLNIAFTFAATATPSFLSDSAVRCKPSTPSVEITDPAFRNSAPPILATAS